MSPANWGACYRSFSATLSGREKDFSNWFALNSRKGRKRGHDAPKLDQPPAGSDHRRGRPRPGYPSKGLRERTNQSARCLPSGRRSSFPSPRSQESNQGLWGCWRRQWEASHTTSIRTECYFSSLLHWRRVRPHEAVEFKISISEPVSVAPPKDKAFPRGRGGETCTWCLK